MPVRVSRRLPPVQALRSSQDDPSGLTAPGMQMPVGGSQVPVSWQLIVHTTGLLPWQAPARQRSLCVQALPSLQRASSGRVSEGVQVPEGGAEALARLLRPRQTWRDPAAYDAQARMLAGRFAANFGRYAGQVSETVRGAARPQPAE